MNLESEFTFGKYKGSQVEDVIEDDPEYIRWLCENTGKYFDDEVHEALERRERRR